jgi:hypothetical protein
MSALLDGLVLARSGMASGIMAPNPIFELSITNSLQEYFLFIGLLITAHW